VLLALASALMYAIYIPMIDHLGRDLPPAVTSTYASGGAAVILLILAFVQGGLGVHFTPVAWGAIVTMAVVSTVLAFIAFLRGLAAIGPVRTAIVSTIEPFWTALLGGVVLVRRSVRGRWGEGSALRRPWCCYSSRMGGGWRRRWLEGCEARQRRVLRGWY